MAATVNDIRQDAIRMLSQVAGTGTQMYSEDKLLLYIRQAFNAVFKQDFWPEYCEWTNGVAVDGTSGALTSDIPYAKHDDIQYIWQAGTRRRVPPLVKQVNPQTITGSTPQWYIPSNTDGKCISILPIAAAGSIDLYGRVHPGESIDYFNPDTDILFDRDLITIAAALEYATDDGDNPNAISKLQSKYRNRYNQVKPKSIILTTSRAPDIPSSWYDR